MSEEAGEPQDPSHNEGRGAPELIEALLEVWSDLMDIQPVKLRTETHHGSVPIVVHGLVAHTAELARGVLVLLESGSVAPTYPLIRSMIEDVVTAEYIVLEPDGWEDILDWTIWQRDGIRKDLEKLDGESAETQALSRHLDLLRGDGRPRARPPQIKDRFLEKRPGHVSLYPFYRVFSDLTHAGMGVVTMYTSVVPGTSKQFVFDNVGSMEDAPRRIGVAPMMLHRALKVWNDHYGDDAHEERLREIGMFLPRSTPESGTATGDE